MVEWLTSIIILLGCWFLPWNQSQISDRIFNRSIIGACDLIVDAGPDTSVCYPGGVLTLMGSVTGNVLYTQWMPSSGLSNPFILNPVAAITGPITYTLTAYGIDPDSPNLVVNGDFELGNTGFTSDYSYVADLPGSQDEMVPEGTYTVINNPNLVHNGFVACNDHTAGGVNMMVVNGAASLQDIWCQTIPVTPNLFYNVSAWVASVSPNSPAILRFSINGTAIGPIVNAPSATCQWVPFNATWNSGSNTSATLCIINLNTALNGNDFALDDIAMFGLCAVEDEVDITLYEEIAPEPVINGPAFLCAGETGIYTATFPPDPPIYFYEWIIPQGASIVSGQGTDEVTILWEEGQETEVCLYIETRCENNEGCFEVTIGDVPEIPLISGPGSLCPGEIETLYTQEINPDDQYVWTVPPEVTIISGAGTNEIEIEWSQPGEAEICLEVTNACGSTDNCTFITLFPQYNTSLDTILCVGTTFVINGHTYGNGVWTGTENYVSEDGCDSIVTINVSEAETLHFMVVETICTGDSIFLQEAFQDQAGMFVDTFVTSSGCDSIVITQLLISPVDTTLITTITCNPAEAGITIVTFSTGNCDSTVITENVIGISDTTWILAYSCFSTDTGQTIQMFTNQSGCDSLVIIHISLLNSDITNLYDTSCDPSQAGVSIDTLINVFGCDSFVIHTTTYSLSDTTYISSLSCFAADTGSTSTLYINQEGCDSLVIQSVIYGGTDTTYFTENICSPADSGLFITVLANQFGCDSVISSYFNWVAADTTIVQIISCEPQDTGVTVQHFTNNGGCDSLVITTTVLDSPDNCLFQVNTSVQQPRCYGDTAWLHFDIQLGLGPFEIIWTNSGQTGSTTIADTGLFSLPLVTEGEIIIELISANGLQLFDTVNIESVPPLDIEIQIAGNYSGYGIPCKGDKTGELNLNIISGGTPPLTYHWSTGDSSSDLMNLGAGFYQITVTDANDCATNAGINITEPDDMQYDINVNHISCFGLEDGGVFLSNIAGGVIPWMTSLDENSFQDALAYTELKPGSHELVIKDQNGCIEEEQFILTSPEHWSLNLGPDTMLAFGSSFIITPTINGNPSGALDYSWSDGLCDNCVTRMISSDENSIFGLTVTDDNGCTNEDEIWISVFIDRSIYIPNVFSPNDDLVNDQFLITSGAFVEEIEELSIYDRWGNQVYSQFHFPPNVTTNSWDGMMNGRPLNPGVYAYKIFVKYKDGKREMKVGDITLLR